MKQGAGLTVLVVDDYADTRELIRTLLEMKGCHVVEAANGQEAVNIAARIAFSFILMDLDMPVLDGYEATREILSQPGTKDVPIIAFSANYTRDWQQTAIDAGCTGYIQKPVDFTLIDGLVSRYSQSTVD